MTVAFNAPAMFVMEDFVRDLYVQHDALRKEITELAMDGANWTREVADHCKELSERQHQIGLDIIAHARYLVS